MSIIPIRSLSSEDLARLGRNAGSVLRRASPFIRRRRRAAPRIAALVAAVWDPNRHHPHTRHSR